MRQSDKTPRKTYQVKTLLDLLYQNEQHMKITYDGDTLYTDDDVYRELYKYQDFFYVMQGIPTTPAESASMDFLSAYNHFVTLNKENLHRMQDALYAEYNPIENYSLNESGIDGTKTDHTKSEYTPSGTTTYDTTIKKYGLNSGTNGENSDKNTMTEKYTNRKNTTDITPDNTLSSDFDGVTHSGYHESKEHFFKRSGNIGTMTPSDMIAKEYRIRQMNLLTRFLNQFIMEYCFYVS